ncbi:MAG: threonine synthase [Pseudomonadota bacterium]
MRYTSTRGDAPVLEFEDVLLTGLARDGGLYLPVSWPRLDLTTIAGFADRPFHDVAATVIQPFVGDAFDRDTLTGMCRDAYTGIGHEAVTPIVQTAPNRFVLELFHGPTLAFKDVAMQLLARMMDRVLDRRGARATIVGATSGDTGGAAIEAFRGAARSDVAILYPDGRVSDVQRRMMTTPTEPNVTTFAVNGTFDDCQALVKAMFVDHAFRDRVSLSGVNSINWARIVAQVTYYFVAGVALGAPHRRVSFVVPTGNFGDIFAGFVAKQMGLPIERLVIASNANDILPRAVQGGVYERRGVVATTSPSMDIEVSSNFERYLFEAQGRDAAVVRGQLASLAQSGQFSLGAAAPKVAEDFAAVSADEATVARCIRDRLDKSGYLLDPHTACGEHAADVMAAKGHDQSVPVIILATAHPAKFPDAMQDITGNRPELPPRLAHLMTAPERLRPVENDLSSVEAAVSAHAGVGQ